MARWNPEGRGETAGALLHALADELRTCGFDGDAAARLLGAADTGNLLRNSALYALWSRDRVTELLQTAPGICTQLFVRNGPVPEERYRRLPAGLRRALEGLELVERSGTSVRSPVSVSPCGSLYLLSDPVFGCHGPDGTPVMSTEPDPVMPPHASSLLLLEHLRPSGGRLLDLGCGSGVLGLALAPGHTGVTGVDILPRAAAFSRVNALLNRLDAEFRTGDFRTALGPARSVDHLVFNAPGRAPRRDGPPEPDPLSPARLLKEATGNIVDVLAPGGLAQILLIVAVPEDHSGPAEVIDAWLPALDRITEVRVAEVDDPALSISATAIRRLRVQPGCLLADDRRDAEWLLSTLRRRGIREVKPIILSIST